MRREQVHKICANHFISSEMKLTPMDGYSKDTAWKWIAMDGSDEVDSKFAIRFKLAETAKEFEKVFNESKEFADGGEDELNENQLALIERDRQDNLKVSALRL